MCPYDETAAFCDGVAVATDAFTPAQGTNRTAQSPTLAILHAAIHDALDAIGRGVYAGVHFRHAVKDGGRQGRGIGRAAAEALGPVQ